MAWPTTAVRLFNSFFRCFSTGTVLSCKRWKIFINEQAESLLILISLNFLTLTLDRHFSDIIENDFHLETEPRYHDEASLFSWTFVHSIIWWVAFVCIYPWAPLLFFIMLRDWFVGSIFIMHVYPLGIEPTIINWTWERAIHWQCCWLLARHTTFDHST